jgi:heat shock protein HslJ
LPQVVAASGTRYAAAGVTFWSEGDEASLETPFGSYRGCRSRPAATPWEESRLLGYEFRAIGQEPGWTLEIDEGRSIRFIGDYGERRVHTPAPEPEHDLAGRVTYRAKTEGADLVVAIQRTDCEDVMSGAAMTHDVTVVVNGAEYRGCGRVLHTGELTGVYWRLTEIGGETATYPAERYPHIRLAAEDSRVSGFTTCNRFFGRYAISGRDRIRLEELGSTRMACVDPALARQEQRFIAALQSVNRFAIVGDTLALFANGRPAARFVAVP